MRALSQNSIQYLGMDDFPQRLAKQDPRLVEAVARIAKAVAALPPDARYPRTPPRLFLVGGFVRDVLLGHNPKDLDAEVYGVPPERLEELLQRLYPGLVNTVGRSFGILKIHLGDDIGCDISIPRQESKTGKGHKGFAISGDPGMSTTEAARRRDFTVNAVLADPLNGDIIDPFDGLRDAKRKILRVIDPKTFIEDPLRVYRAIQFAARFHFTVDADSQQLMREMVQNGSLRELSPERITDELRKLLVKAQKPSVGFELALELGVIEVYFPELFALIATPQEPEWHPEGNVWIHTMMVVDQAARLSRQVVRHFSEEDRLQIVFAALCHDLGKPATTQVIDGRIRSRGHEEAAETPIRLLCSRLTFAERMDEAVIAIAKDHLKPAIFHRDLLAGTLSVEQYSNAIRKLLKRVAPTDWKLFLTVTEADWRGRKLPNVTTAPYVAGAVFSQTIRVNKLDEEPTKPLLQGRDLAELGIPAGPRMGKLIAQIEELRDKGELTTREEALEQVAKLIDAE